MSVFPGATNLTINNGNFTAISSVVGPQSDIVSVLHGQSATSGLLNAAERFDAPKCDEGTRVSMLQGMRNFVLAGDYSSSPAIYWLHGPAGVGKSALAQSLALALKDEGNHAASFFFSRTAPGRSDGNQLIVTLAYQLAVNFPDLQPFMANVVKGDPSVLTASNITKIQHLIVGPINRLQQRYKWSPWWWAYKLLGIETKLHPRLIVVDGLDECFDPEVQRDILLSIAHAVQSISLPLRFVVTSRPDSHIMATFLHEQIFQHPRGVNLVIRNLGEDEDADEQITTFLLGQFAEIRKTHPIRDFLPKPWPLPGQLAQLVSKSSRGFIYPVTVIRYIKMPNNRPDECLERILGLSEIPARDKPYEPLDMLYRFIFQSVPDENKEAVRNIFHFLVIPSNLDGLIEITPRLLEECLGYKAGHVQQVLRDLLCIVSFGGHDEPIKVLHASLPDFLLDMSRSDTLYIAPGDAHAAVAAIFPSAFTSKVNPEHLPDYRFVPFLEHMMQANIAPGTLVYRGLVDVSFKLRHTNWPGINSSRNAAVNPYLDSITFVVAYLLVLMIKNVNQKDIRRHIAEMKADLRKSPFVTFLDSTDTDLVHALSLSFRKWALSGVQHHHYIRSLLALEVTSVDAELHRHIFDLYFMKVVAQVLDWHPFPHPQLDFSMTCTRYNSQYHSGGQYMRRLESPESVAGALLGVLLYDHDEDPHAVDLISLVVDLLGVCLSRAKYSTSLIQFLNDIALHFKYVGRRYQQIQPFALNYLQRAYLEQGLHSEQKILELTRPWVLPEEQPTKCQYVKSGIPGNN